MTEVQPRQMLPKTLHFVRREQITPHLIRVIVSGDELKELPPGKHGAHIKLFFANQQSGKLQLPRFVNGEIQWPEHKPVARAYTLRWYDPDSNEMAIDFVAHGDHSPGAGWAIHAQPGDLLGLAGPAGPDPLLAPADWHLLVGDLTAVPAISAILENLPSHAAGEVFIEVDSADDQHDLICPAQMSVHWLVRSSTNTMPLVAALKSAVVPEEVDVCSAFVAGENATVVECRRYLTKELGIDRKNLYAVPYWKRGLTEEAYHMERHAVMDALD